MSVELPKDTMMRVVLACALLALAGCAGMAPEANRRGSPCPEGEASWSCQVQRYHDVAAQ